MSFEEKIIYRMDTKKAKITILALCIFVAIIFLTAPILRGLINSHFSITGVYKELSEYRKVDIYLLSLIFPLVIFIPALICMIFKKEWHLERDGVRAFRKGKEMLYIPWESVSIPWNGYLADNRNGKRYGVGLSPDIQHEMFEKIWEILSERGIKKPQKMGKWQSLILMVLLGIGMTFIIMIMFPALIFITAVVVNFAYSWLNPSISENFREQTTFVFFFVLIVTFIYLESRHWHLWEKIINWLIKFLSAKDYPVGKRIMVWILLCLCLFLFIFLVIGIYKYNFLEHISIFLKNSLII